MREISAAKVPTTLKRKMDALDVDWNDYVRQSIEAKIQQNKPSAKKKTKERRDKIEDIVS